MELLNPNITAKRGKRLFNENEAKLAKINAIAAQVMQYEAVPYSPSGIQAHHIEYLIQLDKEIEANEKITNQKITPANTVMDELSQDVD